MESVKHTISNIMGSNKEDTTSGTQNASSTSTATGPTTTGSSATGGYERGAASTGSNTTGSTGDETYEHGGHAPIHDAITQGRDTEHQSSQTMGHGTGLEHQSHQPTTQGTSFEHQSGSGYGSTHGTDSQYQAPAHEATSHSEQNIHQQAQHAHQEHQAQQTTSHGSDSTEHKSHHGLPNLLHHKKSPETSSSDQIDESSSSHHQNTSQGRDPAVIGNDHEKKLTGTGAPGSHSAVFGLTPTGEKITDTDSTTTAPRPAHSKSRDETAGEGDNSSRAPAGGDKLSEQMHNPRDQGPKGLERTDPVSSMETSDSAKPGAGGVGLSQGTGDVRPGEKGGDA